MIQDLIIKSIKNSHKIPPYLYRKTKNLFYRFVLKRVPFSHDQVVGGVSGLPEFGARLYKEIKLLQKAIGNYHSTRSLEIGCGYGRLTPWIADYSNEHFAIDTEPRLLSDACKLNPNVFFYKAKVQNLPFPDNYFDLCVSWTVIMHIPPEELPKAIKEIKRVLKPTAIIVLAEETEGKGSMRYWPRPLTTWENLLSPWKLVWKTERKLEETYKEHAGMVLRFKNPKGAKS